jgi:peroxiredoxin
VPAARAQSAPARPTPPPTQNHTAPNPPPASQPARATAALPKTPKAWLGIGIEYGVYGVRVNEVIRRTPAQHCGLRVGDEIVSVGSASVLSPNSLIARVGGRPPGTEVNLTVRRNGQRLKVNARLDALPSEGEILRLRLLDRFAPSFRLPVVGKRRALGLSSLRGKVVVVVFWASWNPASRATHIPLTKLINKFGYRGLEVIAVSTESDKVLHAYLKKNSVPFTVLRDSSGTVGSRLYRAPSIPAVVVIDRTGVIRHAGIGAGANMDLTAFAVERALRNLYQ